MQDRTPLICAIIALAAVAAPATAQTTDPAAFFQSADKNGDGTLSRDEWVAAGRREQTFDRVDTDHDGKVTLDEIKAALERRQQRR